MSAFLIAVFFILSFSNAFAAPRRFPIPEIPGNYVDDNKDGTVDETVADSISEDSNAAGQYYLHFKDCGKTTYANVADVTFPESIKVEKPLGTRWTTGQLLCRGTLAAGTYKLYLKYTSNSVPSRLWVSTSPIETPVNSAGMTLPANATLQWQEAISAGSNANFKALVNSGGAITFVHGGGAFNLFLKTDGEVALACAYLTTLASPETVCPSETPPPLVTDYFNRVGPALGGNWAGSYTGSNDAAITSNRLRLTATASNSFNTWIGTAIGNNQAAEIKIPTWTGSVYREAAILLRFGTSPTTTGYFIAAVANAGGDTTRLFKDSDGNGTVLQDANSAATWAAGDSFRAQIVGGTINAYQNDTLIFTYTDPSPITSGKTGVGGYIDTGGALSDFEIDDFNTYSLSDSSTPTYWVSTSGNDSNACTNSATYPGDSFAKLTIAAGIGCLANGGTLMLADGTYAGEGNNIDPPDNLNGTATAPITIKAANDGAVTIDGGGARIPIYLYQNAYWIIEGINVHNSSADVVTISTGANNAIIRRVCAWDANTNANADVFSVTYATNVTLEDTCGFGTGRKIYQNYSNNGSTIVRRAWAQWNANAAFQNDGGSPKTAFSTDYNAYNAIFENVIGTINNEGGAAQYLSTLGPDGFAPGYSPKCGNNKLLGSIGYVRSADTVPATPYTVAVGFLSTRSDCYEVENTVFDAGATDVRPVDAGAFEDGSPTNLALTNITEIGTVASVINTSADGWTVTNRATGANVAAVPNIWNGAGTSGARVCKRYVNGSLTATPLWPWPMDSRINAALTASGRSPDTVFGTGNTLTTFLESVYGTIPGECQQ